MSDQFTPTVSNADDHALRAWEAPRLIALSGTRTESGDLAPSEFFTTPSYRVYGPNSPTSPTS
jgi:hypothetical protein